MRPMAWIELSFVTWVTSKCDAHRISLGLFQVSIMQGMGDVLEKFHFATLRDASL